MNFLKNHPLFGGILVALGVVALAEAGLAIKFRADAAAQAAL